MLRSLRSRLAWTMFLIGGLALAGMSVIVDRSVRRDLMRRDVAQVVDAGSGFAEYRFRDVLDPAQNFERVFFPGVQIPSGGRRVRPPRIRTAGLGEIYTELRNDDDSLAVAPRAYQLDSTLELVIKVPEPLPTPTTAGVFLTVRSSGGDRYLAQYRRLSTTDGRVFRLLTAIRSQDSFDTLRRLRLVLLFSSVAVLAAVASAAWWVARLGLRPLRRIEYAAATIAGGDLSFRVDDVDARTEVGRLGSSLNQMMGQIEQAFGERAASQARLERFVADASHELRTPLTAIQGHAQLQLRDRTISDPTRSGLVQIESASVRMASIVESLLTLARGRSGPAPECVAVRVDALLESVASDARAARPDRDIVVTVAAAVSSVVGDERRLYSALANLVDNALRYTSGAVAIDAAMAGPAVVLSVTDTGPGLAAGDLAHIFEPFYRVDPGRSRATGGSGLGLAIVASDVEAMGGRVDAESDPVGGSKFWIELRPA